MSSKLDQSLEEIAGTRRARAPRPARRGGKPTAPVAGGIGKKAPAQATRAAKPARAAAVAAAVQTRGDSKIIVSNLPEDVNEQQIKEYFTSTVGPVKKVLLNYNKTGRSVGVATIIFAQPGSAAEAAKTYDGVKVDGRPMKIEVILGAKYAPPPPAVKTLGERIAGPKNAAANNKTNAAKPKRADAPKPAAGAANGTAGRGGAARGRGGRRGGAQRRPKKTADELDADMKDYFEPNEAGEAPAAANGTTAPAATNGGDAGMEDEIM